MSLRPLRGSTPDVVAALRDWLAVEAEPEPLIVETSGSTGRAQAGAAVAQRLARLCGRHATSGSADPGRWLLALPVSYVAGLQVAGPVAASGARAGAVLRRVRGGRPRRSATRTARYAALVPTQLHRLLADATGRRRCRTSTRVLLGGGAGRDPGLSAAAAAPACGWSRRTATSETCGGLRLRRRPPRRGRARPGRRRRADPDRRAGAVRRLRRRARRCTARGAASTAGS